MSGVSDQHPELALATVQPPNPYRAKDPLLRPGDRNLPGGDQVSATRVQEQEAG